jgi:malate dehydrogenase
VDKITVVGAGHVGATAAQRIAERELAREVVVVDILEGVPQGKALDQWESAPVEGFDTMVTGAQDYEQTAGSGVYVVTAGLARKPGMSRDDLVQKNTQIIRSVSEAIAHYSPEAIIVMVTNPLDVMAYVAKAVRASRANGSSAWRGSSTRPGSAASSRWNLTSVLRISRRWSWEVTVTAWSRSSVP